MRCDDATAAIASLAAGETPRKQRAADHVATCLRCQAEVARRRRVRSALATLRGDRVEPGPELLPDLLVTLREVAAHDDKVAERRRLAAYVGGAAAAGGLVLAMASGRVRPAQAATAVHRLVG